MRVLARPGRFGPRPTLNRPGRQARGAEARWRPDAPGPADRRVQDAFATDPGTAGSYGTPFWQTGSTTTPGRSPPRTPTASAPTLAEFAAGGRAWTRRTARA